MMCGRFARQTHKNFNAIHSPLPDKAGLERSTVKNPGCRRITVSNCPVVGSASAVAELARHLEKSGPTARVINAVNLLQFDPATGTLDPESFPALSTPFCAPLPFPPSPSRFPISPPFSMSAGGLVGVLANNLRRVIVIPLRSCRSVNALRFVTQVKTSRLWIYRSRVLDSLPQIVSNDDMLARKMTVDHSRAGWKTSSRGSLCSQLYVGYKKHIFYLYIREYMYNFL